MEGDDAALDKSGEVAERHSATLRLKEGGAFYAPSPLVSIAIRWPKLVGGRKVGTKSASYTTWSCRTEMEEHTCWAVVQDWE